MQLLLDKRMNLSDSVVNITPDGNCFELFLVFIQSRLGRKFWIDRFSSVILFIVILLFIAAVRLKGTLNFDRASFCSRVSICGLISIRSHFSIWICWIRLGLQ